MNHWKLYEPIEGVAVFGPEGTGPSLERVTVQTNTLVRKGGVWQAVIVVHFEHLGSAGLTPQQSRVMRGLLVRAEADVAAGTHTPGALATGEEGTCEWCGGQIRAGERVHVAEDHIIHDDCPIKPNKIPALWFDREGCGPSDLALQLHPFQGELSGKMPPSLGLRIRAAEPHVIGHPPTVVRPFVYKTATELPESGFHLGRSQVAELHRQLGAWLASEGQCPRIVCLVGSTRFLAAFMRANYEETMAGRIVLSVGFAVEIDDDLSPPAGVVTDERVPLQRHGQNVGCTPEQKVALDALHLRKIEMADEILVINVDGYVGDSTFREILHARKWGKTIRWLYPELVKDDEK